MSADAMYDWASSRRVSDWKLEGLGELRLSDEGALVIRTYDCGPGRRATNAWLRAVELPEAFEVTWRFRSEAANGNTMIIFNAIPLVLTDLFEDPRPEARYCELASYRKLVCHTIGFHRGVYGRPSVLRKLGGNVPLEWGEVTWGGGMSQQMGQATTQHTATEPLKPEDKGKEHEFRLRRAGRGIRFWVNGSLIHDFQDEGQYAYYPEVLVGGRMAFRNFSGFADDVYSSIVVRRLAE